MKAYDNTMLSAFQHCQRYYYYRHILHLDTGNVGAATELGSAIHKGCEVWHMDGDQEKAKKGFLERWKESLDGGMIVSKDDILFRSKEGGLLILQQYMETNPQVRMGSELVGVEQNFEIPLGEGVHYHGRMDIVWDWKGFGLIVIDWKTHKGNWRAPPPSPNNQITGYIHAIGEYFGNENVYGGGIHSIKVPTHKTLSKNWCENSEKLTTKSKVEIEVWKDERMEVVRGIERTMESGIWPMNAPKSCGDFGGCRYKELCDQKVRIDNLFIDCDRWVEKVWDPTDH